MSKAVKGIFFRVGSLGDCRGEDFAWGRGGYAIGGLGVCGVDFLSSYLWVIEGLCLVLCWAWFFFLVLDRSFRLELEMFMW